MNVYIEIVEDKSGIVVKRWDVTDFSGKAIERTMTGMLRNLNHKEYSGRVIKSAIQLELI